MILHPYVGRFAPSPSGLLHFGSLVAALASYLDARANKGRWLIRIENIDFLREQPDAATSILKSIETYGMLWDDSVIYQDSRTAAYQAILDILLQKNKLYPCTCSRKKLTGLNGIYPGYCQKKTIITDQPYSLRLKCPNHTLFFSDRIQGQQQFNLSTLGDFILKRKDSLYAYQLAVTVDDAFQGITHVIRGYDLLNSTPRQLYLQILLNYPHPVYAHIPVITEVNGGDKLSKQNGVLALPLQEPRPLLLKAIKALGLKPHKTLQASSTGDIIKWSIENWNINSIPKVPSIALPALA